MKIGIPLLVSLVLALSGFADTSVSMMDGKPLARSDFYRTPNLERVAAGAVFQRLLPDPDRQTGCHGYSSSAKSRFRRLVAHDIN